MPKHISNSKTTKKAAISLTFEKDDVAVVETNVDDISGEVVGRAIERLLEEGAYDATAISFLGKKGRMGQTIRVTCPVDSAERFASFLVEETGTLGVKISQHTRLIVPRKEMSVPVSIKNFKGTVRVKISDVRGRKRIKPEYADAARISELEHVPLRDVLEIISDTTRRYIGEHSSF